MGCRLLLFFLVLLFIPNQASSQGLGFKSTKHHIANRTSYAVFADDYPEFRDQLEFSFDLSVFDPGSFGFICIIDANNSNRDYSLSYVKNNAQEAHLKLNLKGEENLLTVPVPMSLLGRGKWIHVKLSFYWKSNQIEAVINTKKYEVTGTNLKVLKNAQLFFGKHENMIDVPSFAIRNLVVGDSRETHSFHFKEYAGNIVHDQDGNEVGRVQNPIWIINDSYHWKHRFSYSVNDLVAVNYDSTEMRILVVEEDSLVSFNLERNTVGRKAYTNHLDVPIRLGASFFANGKLRVYEVNDIPNGHPSMAALDLSSYTWTNTSDWRLRQQLHHHNSIFDQEKNRLIIFGGFGNSRFSNSFYSYDLPSNTWTRLSLDGNEITPRFFSGMGQLGDQLILFGGVGNKTGDQSIGKIYYYDCYSVDLKNKKITKRWELNRGDEKLVSTRNLIFSSDKSSFYTLCYPEYIPKTFIKLYRYNLASGDYVVLGDSIPMVSEEILTNANLYLNSNTNELYCVTQEVSKNTSTKINVYSIDTPPISEAELYTNPRPFSYSSYWLPLVGILVFIGGGGGWLLVRRRRTVKSENSVAEYQKFNPDQLIRPKTNAVYIFGIFTVFDRAGQECSHLFSPLLKHLFLLILFRSTEAEGITSEEIYSMLWPSKPLKNAKNLKGVNINKLRTILNDIDGLDLIYEKQYFKLETTTPFYCDYFDFKLLNLALGNESDYERLIAITRKGQLLQTEDNELFDTWKREFADQILLVVPDILKDYYWKREYVRVITMAEVLYSVDELDESAFYYSITSFLKMGDEGSSKKHYNKYVLRYKKLQGEDYNILYPEVVRLASKYVKRG